MTKMIKNSRHDSNDKRERERERERERKASLRG
jgi:hypothetical protein